MTFSPLVQQRLGSCSPRPIRVVGGIILLWASAFLVGCQTPVTLGKFDLPFGPSSGDPDAEMLDTSEIGGPLHRVASQIMRDREKSATSLDKRELASEFGAAEQLYRQEKYEEAEKAFKALARRGEPFLGRLARFKPSKKSRNKNRGNPYHEDALFYIAECQYHQKRYSWAQDSYAELMSEYPSTQYLDRATRRLFVIAQSWLGVDQFATTDEIRQVGFEESGSLPEPKQLSSVQKWPLLPNFFDRERPVFDTEGRALQALKTIWLNDPTGPLADDALMLSAAHYVRKSNYVEADHVFGILRDEYPKSPHLENAFLLGSHVKLASYQGPAYDGRQLDEARELKEATLRLFPQSSDRDRLKDELRQIQDAKAQREWEKVQFYLKKKKHQSVAVYCNVILQEYPNSQYADEAHALLQEIGSEMGSVRVSDPGKSDAAGKVPRLLPQWFEGKSLPRLLPRPSEEEDVVTGRASLSG